MSIWTMRNLDRLWHVYAVSVPVAALACVMIGSVSGSALAKDSGRQDYLANCASCHGVDGKGHGDATYIIPGLNPPNLTTIARRNGGHFPADRVAEVIDGRRQIPSHERFDMPFWGTTMQEAGKEFSPASEAQVKARIARIVEYLESIQVK